VIYAVEMDSGAMIYIQSFIKVGPGIHMLMGGGALTGIQTHRQHEDGISILSVFQYKKSRLKMNEDILDRCSE
jgi:hypothetical protein